MVYELHHSGVKGMKWGVRNDKTSAGNPRRKRKNENGPVTKVKQRGDTTVITAKDKVNKQKAKLTAKANKGAKLVAKSENTKIKVIVANTANVAAGAMRVAAAFVPELAILSNVATAASLVGTVSSLK